MKAYSDKDFYEKEYLLGRQPSIPETELEFWLTMATAEIKKRTFDRVDTLTEIPKEVQMCCCEVSEKLYRFEAAKDSNGMVLQSYGNDGETGTYKSDDMSENAVNKSVGKCIRKWLSLTGLLYCGV